MPSRKRAIARRSWPSGGRSPTWRARRSPTPCCWRRPTGSFAKAEIVMGTEQPAVLGPTSSIVVFAGIEKVLSVKDGRSLEKRVTTGRKEKDQVEIVEGITAGEPVIVEPGNLVAGQPVAI